jgi:hypothetical protein
MSTVAYPEILFGGAIGHFWLKRPKNFKFFCKLKAKTQFYLVHNSLGLGGTNAPLHPLLHVNLLLKDPVIFTQAKSGKNLKKIKPNNSEFLERMSQHRFLIKHI